MKRRLSLALGTLIAAGAVIALAGPAQAAGRTTTISYVGTGGTWAAADPGVTVAANVSGSPFSGQLSGDLEPVDGVLPPWPGCVPGTGTLTVASRATTMALALRGDLCRSVSPAGYLIFKGWHDVVVYGMPGSQPSMTGQGSFDLRLLTDGSLTYAIDGELTRVRR